MKHRLFIGISLPDPLKSAITGLQGSLDGLNLPIIHEPQEKLHITLNFLGRVEEKKIPGVHSLVNRVVSGFRPFEITPSYLDCMYKKHADSYIYLGISGDIQILKSIHRSLSRSLTDFSIPQSDRFFPHITVSRFKKADPESIKTVMDKVGEFDFSPLTAFTVDRLTLYESFLSPKGSYFRRIGTFPFTV